ncbi:ectonucleotide pyrophosphatase/phosphodiesterase [Rossellomorea aquimaris]|uniref:alkaline phosphatase family protein n=1 Tax=Rossellomorea aquimaris TaxID=189382 RepID=UPI001CD56C42|nr:ectonucleotide pyrophosphatase/phosphodiesterase [Rossellomorea aquimaris]MCA1055634.1 ectonucleotide pyrophosphatase/phosphodiesterase [Rossellomorea aquimaris]
MTRLTDHLIVISFDCLSSLDYPLLKELPHFKELLSNGSFCTNVETIYPSVTYPCHATIVTGNYPNRHGIINNTFLQPGRESPDWYWHRRHVKGTTLYDEARKAGLKTAALLWPVTAKAGIDYNMPEIFANRWWHHQVMVSLFNGTPLYQLKMNKRFGHIRKGLEQPALDDFVLQSTVATIKEKRPHLLLVHFTDLDTQRHYHGFSSEEAKDSIRRHDERLGKIIAALKEAGIHERSTVVALGDHSALDETKAIQLNVLLKDEGFISLDQRGRIKDWKAYCKGCDGSAYVYVKDQVAAREVEHLLRQVQENPSYGIERILTGEEAGESGADPTCAFMLEAKRGYYFKDSLSGDLIHTITEEDVRNKRYTWGSHGYSPRKEGYTTIFMAKGKGIVGNKEVEAMHLVDEGPLFAKLLGLDLGATDGSVPEGLIDARI